jgi:hypothetical protein
MDQVATGPVSETAPSRAWYHAPLAEFLAADQTSVFGALARNSLFADDPAQKQAWLAEIEFLQARLKSLSGTLFVEEISERRKMQEHQNGNAPMVHHPDETQD